MTIYSDNIFFWNQKLKQKIDIDDDNSFLVNDGIYRCTLSPYDNTLVQITSYLDNDSLLKNEKDAFKIVNELSKEFPKIQNFTVENPKYKNKPFMFNKNNYGQIIPIHPEDKKINSKNLNKISSINQEKNKDLALKINAEIDNDDANEYEKTRKREYDQFVKNNLSNFIKDDIKLEINGEPEKIKTIDPLLSEDQMKSFITDKLDSIEYDYNKEEDKSKFGQFTYKPSMGFILMVQNVISSEEPKLAQDMYVSLIKKLTKISKEINKTDAKNLEKGKGLNYYKNMPTIYKDFLQQWANGDGAKPVKNSGDYYHAMTSYFPEFISPFIPLYSSKNPSCIMNKKPIDLLKSKILGSDKNPDAILRKEAYISYPLGTSNPLYDSVLMFKSGKNKYQCVLLSTKGGLSGEGASASAAGLKGFIYNSDASIPQKIFTDCKNTHFDASLYTRAYLPYMVEFANQDPYNKFALKVLSAFILSSSEYYQEIVDSIYEIIFQKKKGVKRETSKLMKAKKVQNFLNGDEAVQKCVLAALTYGSYGFAQINSKQFQTGKNGDFYYKYDIQYPAIFSGHIDFSFIKGKTEKGDPIYKKLQFHIMGDKIKVD